jgi:hypothetical protein
VWLLSSDRHCVQPLKTTPQAERRTVCCVMKLYSEEKAEGEKLYSEEKAEGVRKSHLLTYFLFIFFFCLIFFFAFQKMVCSY